MITSKTQTLAIWYNLNPIKASKCKVKFHKEQQWKTDGICLFQKLIQMNHLSKFLCFTYFSYFVNKISIMVIENWKKIVTEFSINNYKAASQRTSAASEVHINKQTFNNIPRKLQKNPWFQIKKIQKASEKIIRSSEESELLIKKI